MMEAKPYIQTLRWESQKGLLTLCSFIAIAIISEFFLVSFFAGSGLTSISVLIAVLLFVVVPIAVIVVLVGSWMYLTKYFVMGRREPKPKKVSKSHRRHTRKTKKSITESFSSTVRGFLAKVFRSDSSANYGRLSFSKAAVRSGLSVFTIFLLSAILLSVLMYPRLFTDFAIRFYNTSSFLQDVMQILANSLVPLASGLNSIAPGFREVFGGLASTNASVYTEANIMLIYVVCQIAAAGISALTAFAYARNIINSYHR
jgi:hypothetical protein